MSNIEENGSLFPECNVVEVNIPDKGNSLRTNASDCFIPINQTQDGKDPWEKHVSVRYSNKQQSMKRDWKQLVDEAEEFTIIEEVTIETTEKHSFVYENRQPAGKFALCKGETGFYIGKVY